MPSKTLKIPQFNSFVWCFEKKWNWDEVRESIKEIPLHKRCSIRALVAALGIPVSTLFMMKKGDAEEHAQVL